MLSKFELKLELDPEVFSNLRPERQAYLTTLKKWAERDLKRRAFDGQFNLTHYSYEIAKELKRLGHVDEAIAYFQEGLKTFSEYEYSDHHHEEAEAFQYLAELYELKGDYTEASRRLSLAYHTYEKLTKDGYQFHNNLQRIERLFAFLDARILLSPDVSEEKKEKLIRDCEIAAKKHQDTIEGLSARFYYFWWNANNAYQHQRYDECLQLCALISDLAKKGIVDLLCEVVESGIEDEMSALKPYSGEFLLHDLQKKAFDIVHKASVLKTPQTFFSSEAASSASLHLQTVAKHFIEKSCVESLIGVPVELKITHHGQCQLHFPPTTDRSALEHLVHWRFTIPTRLVGTVVIIGAELSELEEMCGMKKEEPKDLYKIPKFRSIR